MENKRIFLELSLFLNREMFKDEKISYEMYRMVEDLIMRQIKEIGQGDLWIYILLEINLIWVFLLMI